MIILRISGEHLVRIRRSCSSNVRLKSPKLRKVSILHVETPLGMTLEKTKFNISKQFINS